MHAEIIARLEKLQAPDRETDYLIGRAIVPDNWQDAIDDAGKPYRVNHAFYHQQRIGDQSPTASLDAAIALVERVLPDREWSAGNRDVGGDPWGKVRVGPLESIQDSAPTPAIALLLALFRALSAQGGNDAE